MGLVWSRAGVQAGDPVESQLCMGTWDVERLAIKYGEVRRSCCQSATCGGVRSSLNRSQLQIRTEALLQTRLRPRLGTITKNSGTRPQFRVDVHIPRVRLCFQGDVHREPRCMGKDSEPL